MLDVSNETFSKHNENTSENTETHNKASNASEDKPLTFKDWKMLKDSKTVSNVVKQTKSRDPNIAGIRDCRNNGAGFKVNRQLTAAGHPTPYSSMPKSLNINLFGIYGNSYGNINYGYDNSYNFDGYNGCNNAYPSKKSYVATNFNTLPPKTHNYPESFFATDGIYRQKDVMQKPLPNPSKSGTVINNSLHDLDTEQKKNGKKKNNLSKKQNDSKSSSYTVSPETTSLGETPKVYVPNPNASKDGKAFIPKPKLPEENHQISKEEKKKQWKEYREAMKPFKNREFYNAKRVVQRLGKKDINELDEKELFRLNNAREIMAAHKSHLTAKYSDYVKAEDKSNELGELYVLKKPAIKEWEMGKTNSFQNVGHFSETCRRNVIEPGRKILGGYSNFKGFVPFSMLNDETQRIGQISAL